MSEFSTIENSLPEENKVNNQQEFSVDLLRVYYGRLFPFLEMFNWLSYSHEEPSNSLEFQASYFYRREWSFTINDDIYIRYQDFPNLQGMISSIQKKTPHKIDIGAVYNNPPGAVTANKSPNLKPIERELVFDIDMTDYDDIRKCCTGADICKRCWPYMTMAIKVLDSTLREDFDFRNILWVYSGRRGVHCWVCDKKARLLSNEARGAIVEYLSVHSSTDSKGRQQHPMLARALTILEPYFERYIADESGQGLLSQDNFVSVLSTLPNKEVGKDLYRQWEKDTSMSGSQRWKQLRATIRLEMENGISSKRKRGGNFADLHQWMQDLVFAHCYPRLDANVSKTMNHLLKSPFCVHPKTGRVCVPIDAAFADDFNPFEVPTVRSLCQQIDDFDKRNLEASDTNDTDKTDMKESLNLFHRVFLDGLQHEQRIKLTEKLPSTAW